MFAPPPPHMEHGHQAALISLILAWGSAADATVKAKK
jgi:hypothetical protein